MIVMSMNFIGERLKELRFKRGIKQYELAQKLGVSQAQVARYESYQNKPSYAMIKLVVEILNTTPEYLLGETKEDQADTGDIPDLEKPRFSPKRMKEMRKLRDFTQKELSRRLGISQSQISKYEKGEDEPSYEQTQKLAEYLHIDVRYLYGKIDEPIDKEKMYQEVLSKEKIPASEPLPVYAWASCGHGILTDEKPVDFMTKPSNAKGEFWVIARGDSMKPRIQDGYQLLITEDIFDLKNGDIIIFIYDDELCCKYYSYEKGKYIFYGEDPKFPPIVIEDEDGDDRNFNIIGKVTAMAMVIV